MATQWKMRLVFPLCFIILVLSGVIQCDHHQDHGKNEPSIDVHPEHHNHEHDDHPKKEDMACHKIAATNAEFAFNFYKQVASNPDSKNIFFSPLSISAALAMLSVGAKFNTLHELIEGLGFNRTEITDEELHGAFQHLGHMLNDPKRDIQLNTGSALFIQEGLKVLPKFLADVKLHYDSEAFTSNFQKSEEATKQINDYVEKHTNGKITEMFKNLDSSTLMVLVNYIYFKGEWVKKFDPTRTTDHDFHVDEATVVKVPMMSRYTYFHSWIDRELSCTVVELPYRGNVSTIFILPDEGKLKEVEASLSVAALNKWRSSYWKGIVNLHLPKFSISGSLDLKQLLTKMGVTEVFSDQADLAGITGGHDLKASNAVHKAFLSIDEKGTEATATTGIEIIPLSFVFPTKFNRPFLMITIDDITKNILFMGRIANPTLS